ncbi:MAG: type III secretion system translocon subunit SctE [Rubrivivax sp.]|nr:type III secretion system translocon subunit SctE [Rubrivivax sp.]
MTSIATNNVGLVNNLPGIENLPLQLDENTAKGLLPGAVDISQGWMQELLSAVLKTNAKDKNDGVTNTEGAPVLEAPVVDFSGDQLALILAALDTKIKEAQGKTAKEGIEAARQQTESANKDMLEKLQEVIDKQKEAAEKEKENKVWGWIGKIAAVIGAIVATVAAVAATIATGGAAAPLLALAVVGLVAATVDLASQINQEVNPDAEPFTLGSLIGDAIIEAMDAAGLDGKERAVASGFGSALGFLLMQPDLAGQMAEDAAIADGMSAEDAAKLRMGVQIAAVVTTIVAMIAITIASGGASSGSTASSTASNVGKAAVNSADDVAATATKVADGAKKASDAANKVIKASKIIEGGTSVVQGTAGVAQGAIGIQVAEMTQDAEEARAAAKEIEAILLALQAQSEEQTQRLKEIIAALDEGMAQFSQMVAAAGDQRANQVKNLVRA